MKRLLISLLVIVAIAFMINGCGEKSNVTTPSTSASNFETQMKSNISGDVITQTMTTDTDTLVLRVVKTNIGDGYFRWTVIEDVLASENARGYDLPFTYDTSAPIQFVSASLGAVYNCEPGYPWGDVYDEVGYVGSSHVKIGQTYTTWSTCDSEFAVFIFESTEAFWTGKPKFTWKTSGEPCVAVRDPDNGDLPFVLKVK